MTASVTVERESLKGVNYNGSTDRNEQINCWFVEGSQVCSWSAGITARLQWWSESLCMTKGWETGTIRIGLTHLKESEIWLKKKKKRHEACREKLLTLLQVVISNYWMPNLWQKVKFIVSFQFHLHGNGPCAGWTVINDVAYIVGPDCWHRNGLL